MARKLSRDYIEARAKHADTPDATVSLCEADWEKDGEQSTYPDKANGGLDQHGKPIPLDFPDWRQVVPQGEPVYTLCFNADLLEDLVKIVRAADENGKKRSVIKLEMFEEKECVGTIRVTASSAPRFCGLLMPCRPD